MDSVYGCRSGSENKFKGIGKTGDVMKSHIRSEELQRVLRIGAHE